ncbi:hypothetical protein SPHINGOR109_50845 [Sphingorhabdus sp. 109]|nr:hypothetical protein SPHINGOR109_50845 [Sphingorhabdus sp. 109]
MNHLEAGHVIARQAQLFRKGYAVGQRIKFLSGAPWNAHFCVIIQIFRVDRIIGRVVIGFPAILVHPAVHDKFGIAVGCAADTGEKQFDRAGSHRATRRHVGTDAGVADHPGQPEIGLFVDRSVAIEHFDPLDPREMVHHLPEQCRRVAVDRARHFNGIGRNDPERTILAIGSAGRFSPYVRLFQAIFENLDRFGDRIAAGADCGLDREEEQRKQKEGPDQKTAPRTGRLICCCDYVEVVSAAHPVSLWSGAFHKVSESG